MERLTDELKYPLDNFLRCQRCGLESTDRCKFRFWCECDDEDNPEDGNVFLLCRGECEQVLKDHPRGYAMIPWGGGSPGHFVFVCGDCPHREGVRCTHPDLKANGGEGLRVVYRPHPLGGTHVCFSDGTGGNPFPPQVKECDGLTEGAKE